MALFTGEELREVISVKMLSGDASRWAKQRIRRLSLDSRAVRPGDLFIAIRGDRFDGHDYVAAALERVAATRFDTDRLRRHAEGFSRAVFDARMQALIAETAAAPVGTRW